MDDEAEIRLVEAHAERGRRDQCLDPVGQQIGLGCLTLGVIGLAAVARHLEAARAQERRGVVAAAATVSV